MFETTARKQILQFCKWQSLGMRPRHNDFQAVIDAHDFTMINFYADWWRKCIRLFLGSPARVLKRCSHCRNFAPTWFDFEKSVNEQATQTFFTTAMPYTLEPRRKITANDADGQAASVRPLSPFCGYR